MSAQLEAAITMAAAGTAQIMVVEGDPGSGKTALCQHTVRRAAGAGFRVVQVAGVQGEADLPLAGLSLLLRPLMTELDDLVGALPTGQQRAIRAAAGLGDEPIVDRFTLGAALLGLATATAEQVPVLIVIDDVHWLDRPSAEAVSFAVRRLGADAVMVLVATRPDRCPLELGRDIARAHIGGLNEADVAALLDDAGLPTATPVVAAVIAATGGVPLAVLETARALSPEHRAGRVALPQPLPIGRDVTAAYRARLGELSERTRLAAALVAAAGSVPADIITAALVDVGLGLADLLPAEEIGVLTINPLDITFTHPLLRAAALYVPTHSQRRVLHHALAEACAGDHEQRARHLVAAAAGPDSVVAAALDAAASDIARRGGMAAAAPLLAQAAAFSEPGEVRYARLLTAAVALGLAGLVDAAVEAAREVLGATSDPGRRADAAMVIVDSSFWGADSQDLFDLASGEAARIAPTDPDRAVQGLLRACSAVVRCGEMGQARQLSERAVALVDSRITPTTAAAVELIHALVLTITGRQDEARAVLNDWAPPSPEWLTAASPSFVLFPATIQTLLRLGRLSEAQTLLHTLTRVCHRDCAPLGTAWVLATATELQWWQGNWSQAVASGDQSAALAEQTGQLILYGYTRAVSARVAASRGDEARCRSYADTGMVMASTHNSRSMRLYALSALGLLELGLGNLHTAADLLVAAEETRLLCQCLDPVTVPFGADLVEALTRAGRVSDAHDALERHTELAENSGGQWARATMARCAALLRQDPDEADALFATAIELHPPEMPFDAARTRLCWGQHLRRRRNITASREHLTQALTTFERLGARPWAERAATELRAAGGKARTTRSPDLHTLSPQEMHCALAAADGMSNRDVAAALFISAKTVEYHLGKVYTKLGIISRTQLGRILNSTERDNHGGGAPGVAN